MNEQKVFGIGFHKTGTKSLAEALTILGYKVTGPNGTRDPYIARNVYDMACRLIKEYDAFQDNPWPIIYPWLLEQYPNSKFILTIRPTEQWIKSVVRYFGTESTPMREWIYGVGSPIGNEEIYIRTYESHNEKVMRYFHDKPNLLVLKLTEGEGWGKLCPFLGKAIPEVDFPHANRSVTKMSRNG